MDNKEFKKTVAILAKKNGFEHSKWWFKESTECIIALELQQSSYSNLYYLNIKIYIQGLFGRKHSRDKNTLKTYYEDIPMRQPPQYAAVFDLEQSMDDAERILKLEEFFIDFLVPFTNKALTKSGIYDLIKNGQLGINKPTKEELRKLMEKAI
ncbi:MAG: hypothetical protein JWQ09_5511 [Segetibacter sp.]|nr:hypothetical protein [Segetibacter sp.]